ncbi:MAG: hypothetical protein ACHQUC_07900 [Chlamydiales bacterium]
MAGPPPLTSTPLLIMQVFMEHESPTPEQLLHTKIVEEYSQYILDSNLQPEMVYEIAEIFLNSGYPIADNDLLNFVNDIVSPYQTQNPTALEDMLNNFWTRLNNAKVPFSDQLSILPQIRTTALAHGLVSSLKGAGH